MEGRCWELSPNVRRGGPFGLSQAEGCDASATAFPRKFNGTHVAEHCLLVRGRWGSTEFGPMVASFGPTWTKIVSGAERRPALRGACRCRGVEPVHKGVNPRLCVDERRLLQVPRHRCYLDRGLAPARRCCGEEGVVVV